MGRRLRVLFGRYAGVRQALLLAALAAVPAGAQEVAVGAAYHFPLGDRYELVEPGRSVVVELAFGDEAVQYGIGGGLFSYDLERLVLDLEGADAYGFARYRFGGGPVVPTFGIRAGYTYQRIQGGTTEPSDHGFAIGPIGGIQIPAGPVAVEISGAALVQVFGEADLTLPGIPREETTGYRASGRLMLVVPLG